MVQNPDIHKMYAFSQKKRFGKGGWCWRTIKGMFFKHINEKTKPQIYQKLKEIGFQPEHSICFWRYGGKVEDKTWTPVPGLTNVIFVGTYNEFVPFLQTFIDKPRLRKSFAEKQEEILRQEARLKKLIKERDEMIKKREQLGMKPEEYMTEGLTPEEVNDVIDSNT